MKLNRHLLILLIITEICFAQTKIVSWNIENFGKSKSDSTIVFIAKTLRKYDVIALQEVVAGEGGAQAVAKLADELNNTGNKWDYTISDPTTSSAYKKERYAFLWKTAKIKKIGKAWLEQKYNLEMDREPYLCTFECNAKQFTLVNFHAITKTMQPEKELKYFKKFPESYPKLNLIFLGDFNCPQSHTVFIPLRKMGFESILKEQKTSLKKSCFEHNCLASEFDNMFYFKQKTEVKSSGVIHFYKDFTSMENAGRISDHIPIWATFNF